MSAQVISISHTSQLLLLLLFVMVGHSLVWLVCWRHAWPITMWWCCFWLFNAAAFCSSFKVIFIIKKSDENFYCAEERKKGIFQMHPLLEEQRREKGRERERKRSLALYEYKLLYGRAIHTKNNNNKNNNNRFKSTK